MHMIMPRPTIRCSQCGSTDIVRPEMVAPEWPANSSLPRPAAASRDGVELRCKVCGHEKRHEHRSSVDGYSTSSGVSITPPKEETF